MGAVERRHDVCGGLDNDCDGLIRAVWDERRRDERRRDERRRDERGRDERGRE